MVCGLSYTEHSLFLYSWNQHSSVVKIVSDGRSNCWLQKSRCFWIWWIFRLGTAVGTIICSTAFFPDIFGLLCRHWTIQQLMFSAINLKAQFCFFNRIWIIGRLSQFEKFSKICVSWSDGGGGRPYVLRKSIASREGSSTPAESSRVFFAWRNIRFWLADDI